MKEPQVAPQDVAEVKKRLKQVELSQKALNELEGNLKKYVENITKVLRCLDSTGRCLQEATGAMAVHLEDRQQSAICRESCMPLDTLHQVAKVLTTATRDIQDGNLLVVYKDTLHKHIFGHIDPLRQSAKHTLSEGQKALLLLKKLHDKDTTLARKEQKYVKKGKALTESKRYTKQVNDRDKARSVAEAQVKKFKNFYGAHMVQVELCEGEFLDSFIKANAVLLQQAGGTFTAVGERVLREYPNLAGVLVLTANHVHPSAVHGTSPPTRASRLKTDKEDVDVNVQDGVTHVLDLEMQPLNGTPPAGNLYALDHVEVESRNSPINGSYQEPLTPLHPPVAQGALHAPDDFDSAVNDAYQQPLTKRRSSSTQDAHRASDEFDGAVKDAPPEAETHRP
ncbi:hypothetical protein TraAM80_03378 [Trypanosoma rangeli]|uniref:Uncharacterized protein n=1 Tax=Trypanosoma rangeli TaxID=5698 RepID=A0A422NP32_TRYRA|nr:uncharacterized protein TraAM80_03378 [Trypanosoma rangeli]RNF07257.1 hypothetical protein TraAM80_03378 [Trypanosoma rangeli]|eukprot:RNF07257.1 hypothetical protein TraAM80_03378 [Trypanosoma rangeli]